MTKVPYQSRPKLKSHQLPRANAPGACEREREREQLSRTHRIVASVRRRRRGAERVQTRAARAHVAGRRRRGRVKRAGPPRRHRPPERVPLIWPGDNVITSHYNHITSVMSMHNLYRLCQPCPGDNIDLTKLQFTAYHATSLITYTDHNNATPGPDHTHRVPRTPGGSPRQRWARRDRRQPNGLECRTRVHSRQHSADRRCGLVQAVAVVPAPRARACVMFGVRTQDSHSVDLFVCAFVRGGCAIARVWFRGSKAGEQESVRAAEAGARTHRCATVPSGIV